MSPSVSKIAFFSPFSYNMNSYRLNLAESSLLIKQLKSLKFRTPFPTFSLSFAELIVNASIKINLVPLKLSLFVKAIQLFYRDARLKGRLVFQAFSNQITFHATSVVSVFAHFFILLLLWQYVLMLFLPYWELNFQFKMRLIDGIQTVFPVFSWLQFNSFVISMDFLQDLIVFSIHIWFLFDRFQFKMAFHSISC